VGVIVPDQREKEGEEELARKGGEGRNKSDAEKYQRVTSWRNKFVLVGRRGRIDSLELGGGRRGQFRGKKEEERAVDFDKTGILFEKRAD